MAKNVRVGFNKKKGKTTGKADQERYLDEHDRGSQVIHSKKAEDDISLDAISQAGDEWADEFDSDVEDTKWYEKVTALVGILGSVLILAGAGIYVFQDDIGYLLHDDSSIINRRDIVGDGAEYIKEVKDVIKEESTESKETADNEKAIPMEGVNVIGEGSYVVGKDIPATTWFVKDAVIEVYASEDDYNAGKPPVKTNVSKPEGQAFLGMQVGEYLVISAGEIAINSTRTPVEVSLGDTIKLEQGNMYQVGIDLEEGFYNIYNAQLGDAELKKRDSLRDITVTFKGGIPDQEGNETYQVKRKTFKFLQKGQVLRSSGDIVLERVSGDVN